MNQQSIAAPVCDALRGCHEALAQCRAIVELLGPSRFGLPVARHASVGAHMRHCLDHFDQFFAGLPHDEVDYDARVRRPDWENDAAVALDVIADFDAQLAALAEEAPALGHRSLRVWQSVASGADMRRVASSSVERELAFLSSHTIHHLALMRVLIDLAGWDDPAAAEIGVAYSTRAHAAGMS